MAHIPGATYTDMGWEVYPDGFHACLARVARDYAPPAIYVTENGAAFGDVRLHDGSVLDPEREAYLAGHLDAVARAIADGVPIRGYYVWSLLDNFEWSHGYGKRFGIVYVDYATLERVPKSSYYWYRDFAAARREEAHMARIGLMLYTVRGECARDVRADAARGRQRWATRASSSSTSTATSRTRSPSWLADTGLVACGRHASLEAIESELPALAAEAAHARLAAARRQLGRSVASSAPDLVGRLTAAAAAAAAHRARARLPQPRRRGEAA